MSELRKIPNVGRATERDLIAMGYTTIKSLQGKSAEQLYREECALRGECLDRCQLYLLRAVEYFVNSDAPDLSKCPWWFWKDEYVRPSPCGAVCAECASFPKACAGCRKIEGKVYWLRYAGGDVCKVYDCCVNRKGRKNCAGCGSLPCERFTKDPTVSDEQNAENLGKMLKRLEGEEREQSAGPQRQ